MWFSHIINCFFGFVFSSFVIKRQISSTVLRKCGILLAWFAVWQLMKQFVNYDLLQRKVPFQYWKHFWKLKKRPLKIIMLNLKVTYGLVSISRKHKLLLKPLKQYTKFIFVQFSQLNHSVAKDMLSKVYVDMQDVEWDVLNINIVIISFVWKRENHQKTTMAIKSHLNSNLINGWNKNERERFIIHCKLPLNYNSIGICTSLRWI